MREEERDGAKASLSDRSPLAAHFVVEDKGLSETLASKTALILSMGRDFDTRLIIVGCGFLYVVAHRTRLVERENREVKIAQVKRKEAILWKSYFFIVKSFGAIVFMCSCKSKRSTNPEKSNIRIVH